MIRIRPLSSSHAGVIPRILSAGTNHPKYRDLLITKFLNRSLPTLSKVRKRLKLLDFEGDGCMHHLGRCLSSFFSDFFLSVSNFFLPVRHSVIGQIFLIGRYQPFPSCSIAIVALIRLSGMKRIFSRTFAGRSGRISFIAFHTSSFAQFPKSK